MISLGADVAKDSVVIFDGSKTFTLANSSAELKKFLEKYKGASLGVEPTGGYQDKLCNIAYKLGMSVYVIQPAWIRSHRKGTKQRGKTDKIDAMAIHSYLLERREFLHLWRPLPKLLAELRLTLRQRQGLAKDLSRMRQRYSALHLEKSCREALYAPLVSLIKAKEKRIRELLKEIPKSKAILGIPGIGILGASAALCALEHIPFKSADAFVAFAGIDPVPFESGNFKGRSHVSKKGDATLRTLLYLSAVAGSRTKAWKPRYLKLLGKGKEKKKALVSIAMKIAVTLYSIHKFNTTFDLRRLDTQL